MPVIGIPVDMLLERISSRPSRDELVTHLQHLGCDVEGYATVRRFSCLRCNNLMEITETENPPVVCDRCGVDFHDEPAQVRLAGEKDVIRMELLAVRPDMFDPGGLARVLRNYFQENLDSPCYPSCDSGYRVTVDQRLNQPSSQRPFISCAIVRGMNLDDDKVRVIMKLQENLHWALGRDRKRASIGVYDLDTLQGKSFRYSAVAPEELRFVPLGYAADQDRTPLQVLQEHPKGVAYARLLSAFDRYPLLSDESGQVMALIPIINSEQTKVTHSTRNFFIDVTGAEERIVDKTLNTIVTSLLELERGAKLESVTIQYTDHQRATPELTPQRMTFDPARPARQIGIPLDRAGVVLCLRRMGHAVDESGDWLEVDIPAYRNDIMHAVDLVEDVAIAFGYHNIVPTLVPTLTVGGEQEGEKLSNTARAALTGLGFFEVLTLILSNEESQYDLLRRPRGEQHVLLDNPISVEQTMIRVSLVPGLLDTLAANVDHELPQRVFEVGNVSFLDSEVETGAREQRRLAVAAIGPRIDYSSIRAYAEAILRELGWTLHSPPSQDPLFIPGRGAQVVAVKDGQEFLLGVMGEIHPEVLERFKLTYPVALLEMDLQV